MWRVSWKTVPPIPLCVIYWRFCPILSKCIALRVCHRWTGAVRVLLIYTLSAQLESRCTYSHCVLLPWYPWVIACTLLMTKPSQRGENHSVKYTVMSARLSVWAISKFKNFWDVFCLWCLTMETLVDRFQSVSSLKFLGCVLTTRDFQKSDLWITWCEVAE